MEKIDHYEVVGLPGVPTIRAGDPLPELIMQGVQRSRLGRLENSDVLVVASKVVSIQEGRFIDLSSVEPSKAAIDLASQTGKDPRIVQCILGESVSTRLATPKGPIIAIHRLGYELTSAGVDATGDGGAYLLPQDPDLSAENLRDELSRRAGLSKLGVAIVDSDGRSDRAGATVIAIGCAGMPALRITTIQSDGRTKRQEETIVDMIAGAAGLVIGQRGRGMPFAVLRGLQWQSTNGAVREILHQQRR